jgi:endoglucanase
MRRLLGVLLTGAAALAVSLAGPAAAQAAALAKPAAVDGYYQITNPSTGKCADVLNESTNVGAIVQEWDCKNIASQRWAIVDLGNGYYNLVNQNSHQCLDLGTAADPVEQWSCLGYTNEQWQLTLVSTFPQATYQMTNRATTLCLDLRDDKPANGTFIGGYNCVFGIPAQTWALQ